MRSVPRRISGCRCSSRGRSRRRCSFVALSAFFPLVLAHNTSAPSQARDRTVFPLTRPACEQRHPDLRRQFRDKLDSGCQKTGQDCHFSNLLALLLQPTAGTPGGHAMQPPNVHHDQTTKDPTFRPSWRFDRPGRAKTQMQALAAGQFRGGTEDEWGVPAREGQPGRVGSRQRDGAPGCGRAT